MLHQIKLHNVGVAPSMEFNFSGRLNIITGDNGLGKSFLLDVAWWALSRTWPAQVNPAVAGGRMAHPLSPGDAAISFSLDGKDKTAAKYNSKFDRKKQAWTGAPGRPLIPGLVLYAMSDGSFAVWDPARNYWQKEGNIDVQERTSAYVFNPSQIWDGLTIKGESGEKKVLSQGFLADVENWKLKDSAAWKLFSEVVKTLSPDGEPISFGESQRIDLEDSRDIPALKAPAIGSVPVVYASAAMKRILALAYCLAWAWNEHLEASRQLDQKPENNIIFLIDEIEAHLHPKWQRTITGALMSVVKALNAQAKAQLIISTHSPLVMASCEDFFDAAQDSWVDIDLENGTATPRKRRFEKYGPADSWLQSQAFDLASTRAPKAAELIQNAYALLESNCSGRELDDMEKKLVHALSPLDDDLFMWRAMKLKKTEGK